MYSAKLRLQQSQHSDQHTTDVPSAQAPPRVAISGNASSNNAAVTNTLGDAPQPPILDNASIVLTQEGGQAVDSAVVHNTPGGACGAHADMVVSVVDAALDMLSLRGVAHELVGCAARRGISGGQRKRVNIGLELVTRPGVYGLEARCIHAQGYR